MLTKNPMSKLRINKYILIDIKQIDQYTPVTLLIIMLKRGKLTRNSSAHGFQVLSSKGLQQFTKVLTEFFTIQCSEKVFIGLLWVFGGSPRAFEEDSLQGVLTRFRRDSVKSR